MFFEKSVNSKNIESVPPQQLLTMEMAFILLTILLILFALLALYDGFYLHIFKYELYKRKESKAEHLTHTIRAVLFPAILYFLYLKADCTWCFYIGLTLVLIDIIVLGVDAFIEKDSRQFMGGLPRWEYIIHLFVNGFHFASIAVFLAVKIRLDNHNMVLVENFSQIDYYRVFTFVMLNIIPGAILLALLHIFVSIPSTVVYWNIIRKKFTCC